MGDRNILACGHDTQRWTVRLIMFPQHAPSARSMCQPHSPRFFICWLTLYLLYQVRFSKSISNPVNPSFSSIAQFAFALYRAVGTMCRDLVIAQGVMIFYFLLTQLTSGFIVSYKDIPSYWIWYVHMGSHVETPVGITARTGLTGSRPWLGACRRWPSMN